MNFANLILDHILIKKHPNFYFLNKKITIFYKTGFNGERIFLFLTIYFSTKKYWKGEIYKI